MFDSTSQDLGHIQNCQPGNPEMLGIIPHDNVDGMSRKSGRPADEQKELPKAFLMMLREAGLTEHAAAKAAGSRYFLADYKYGKSRSIGADKLLGLAKALGRAPEEVAEALELPVPPGVAGGASDKFRHDHEFEPASPRGAPVRSPPASRPLRVGSPLAVRYEVQAGSWTTRDDHAQVPRRGPPVTVDPAYAGFPQWLELVRGDSADRFFPDGSWVHVVDAVEIGYAPRQDDFVVVERRRAQDGEVERSLKQVEMKRGGIELWPRSHNPKWRAPLILNETGEEDVIVEVAGLVLGGYLPTYR